MAKIARVQHTYNHKSGLPEHAVVNTFYFQHPLDGWAGDQALELAQVVVDFYDVVHPGATAAISASIAESSMAPSRHTVKVYDMGDAEPRAPQIIYTTAGAAPNNVQAPMPSEVAVCLSYRGALVSGLSPARRRGRVYIGPLRSAVVEQDAAGWARPTETFREDMTLAAAGMKADALVEGWTWMVQSGAGTYGDPDIPLGYVPIVHVWVDDAFDTQRRRGANPTLRTTLDI